MGNMFKTFILLAGLTSLFAGCGWLIGGESGMAIFHTKPGNHIWAQL